MSTAWTKNIKKTSQCTSQTVAGKRCKRRSARGDVCFMHLRQQGLKIKKSTIKDAGLGLFTIPSRRKNDYLTNYKGERSRAKKQGDYVLKSGSTYIDAKDSNSCVGRFINDARSSARNNSRFSSSYKYPVSIRATKPIPANSEIFSAYGREYWRG